MERIESVEKIRVDVPQQNAEPGKLLRVLGIGFGLAIGIGGTVGVGILRSPGPVAEQLGSVWLILLAWTLGGLYALLGANYLTELSTMIPRCGGFMIYANRAFGSYGGFVVGWSDWIYNTLGLSFIVVVFGEYTATLFNTNFTGDRMVFSLSILVFLTALNWIGLRAGSATQKFTTLLKTVALLAFVVACFALGGGPDATTSRPADVPVGFIASLVAFVLAFQLILGAYDGWHSAIYFAEEDTNPSQNVPRSVFGGIVIITLVYVLVIVALVYVLPLSQLAASKFAGGDAIAVMFGVRGGQIVTVLALLSLAGIINALLLINPRILLALGREGHFARSASIVNKGGTPVFALATTAIFAALFSSIGTFETLLAVSQFFAVTITILLIISLFILRRREPDTPRPYRAWGYPFAPLLMLVSAVLLFFGYIFSNPWPSMYALMVLAISYPLFLLIRRRRLA